MSTLRNNIFLGVVPVTEQPRPIAEKSSARSSTAQPSTGSALLDSFVADAEQKALFRQAALTQQLTSLSFELQRINGRGSIRPALKETTRPTDKTANLLTAKPAANRPKDTAPTENRPMDGKKADLPNSAAVRNRQKATEQKATERTTDGKRAARQAPKNTIAQKQALTSLQQPAVQAQRSSTAVKPQSISQSISQSNPQSQQATPQVKVYGGSSYKALQAKAAAGGLVNLDDTLLFGGTDKKSSKGLSGNQSLQLDIDFLLSFLSNPIEDFTVSPIPGGIHPTAHLSESAHGELSDKAAVPNRLGGRAWHRAVLDIDTFKLGDLTRAERRHPAAQPVAATLNSPEVAKDAAGDAAKEPAEFSDLSKQVAYLNQRIDYLSKKLAELTAVELPDLNQPSAAMPAHQHRSQIVLATENLQLTETTQNTEQKVSTLDSSFLSSQI